MFQTTLKACLKIGLILLNLVPASLLWAQELPGKLQMLSWEDSTVYSKIYHVAQQHPRASDQNPGTAELPFGSISKAAEVLQAGEKVIIHTGVYREFVQPRRGGTSPKAMISYEAAPGEKVIISGAKPISGTWEYSLNPEGHKVSMQTWQISLDSLLDMSQPNPFTRQNTSDKQMEIMHWATHLTGTVPYTLVRGMVIQDDKRLLQIAHYDDLFRIDGAFWVDTVKHMLHINPRGYAKPQDLSLELTQYEQLFKPQALATSYLRLSGLTFMHAGNGFMRTAVGAVFSNGGNHWIFEHNEIHSINSVGIEIGTDFTEDRKKTETENKRINANRGGMIVRHNEIYDCGTGGIQGHRNFDARVEYNHLHHIGWQDTEYYWECAAIKLLINRRSLVRKNRIHDIVAANAIWLDWDNIHSRITQNLVYDIHPASGGALYIEASRKTQNWIDHNILWNIAELGISVFDSDSIQTFNNLIGKTDLPYISKINTQGRMVDGRPLTSNANVLRYNIFYRNKRLPEREDASNEAHENLFVDEHFETFIKQNWGKGNFAHNLSIEFDPALIRFTSDQPLPRFDNAVEMIQTSRGAKHKVLCGPFQTLFTKQANFKLDW